MKNTVSVPDLQDTQATLSKTLDSLNTLWAKVNERLRKLNLPVIANVWTEEDSWGSEGLSWRKYQHTWQVCWVRCNHDEEWLIRPIVDCTADERRCNLQHVKKLSDEMLQSAVEFSKETNEAIVDFQEAYSL